MIFEILIRCCTITGGIVTPGDTFLCVSVKKRAYFITVFRSMFSSGVSLAFCIFVNEYR